MHKYYLVTPLTNAPSFDPGVTFITHGCKHLISLADPDAYFFHISNTSYSKPDWDILFDQADCLILSGNPLYDPTDIEVYWNFEIWDHVMEAHSRGIPIADLWGYSSHPLPVPDLEIMADRMLKTHRTKRLLEIQSRFDLIITRDLCAQVIASSMRQDVDALPCCSFWSHLYFNVKPRPRTFNAVTLRYMKGQEWILEPLHALSQILAKEKPTFIVCHTRYEYLWAREHLPQIQNLICIYDPISLLNFYSRCDKVISIRLHASIPALSLGCKVINLAIDTRSQALDLFNIPSIPYTELKNGSIPLDFNSMSFASLPPQDRFIERFQKEIISRF